MHRVADGIFGEEEVQALSLGLFQGNFGAQGPSGERMSQVDERGRAPSTKGQRFKTMLFYILC